MAHAVDLDEMLSWLDDAERAWVLYASSSKEPKTLEVSAGRGGYRVKHGDEIVYNGPDGRSAVHAYNAIR